MNSEPASDSKAPQGGFGGISPPPAIPGYALLRCIGRGSYGEVWLAQDVSGGYRAVKVVYRSTFEHDRPFERELSGIQKFEPISRTHPSQVNILSVGKNEAAGYFFYVMELADDAQATTGVGRKAGMVAPASSAEAPATVPISMDSYVPKTLKSELGKRGRLPFQECLEIGLSLTKALDHLHGKGLIHRDIKPSNVIFVHGVPKLADIGLVTDAGATISHVGTEGFLPPEGPGTAQADIYSLGKVLYEISTGRDRLDFPELPTFLGEGDEQRGLYELNLVFLKACQNEPRKRYQSAQDMYADLALLRSGKSLRRARALEQKLANLTRLALAAAAVVVIAGGTYYSINRHRLKRLRDEVSAREREKKIVEKVAQEKSERLASLDLSNAENLEAQADLAGALLWCSQALLDDPDPVRRQAYVLRLQGLLDRCPRVPAIFSASSKINSVAFSPDGLRLITASEDHSAQLWDAITGEAAGPPFKHGGPIHQVAFSGDGQRVITASGDGRAQVWNALNAEPVAAPLKHGQNVLSAAFSPDGRQVLTVAEEPVVLIWEASSGRLRFKLEHRGKILAAAFSPDGLYVATASADQTAQLWDARTGEKRSGALLHDAPVQHLCFSSDSRRLVTASGAQAWVWTVASGTRGSLTLKHEGPLNSLAFSPDGRRILTASEDQTARLWDAITGQAVSLPLRHPSAVQTAAFSPDGRRILTVSANQVRVWDALLGKLAEPLFSGNDRITEAQFSREGDRLAIASADGSARIVAVSSSPPGSTSVERRSRIALEDWGMFARFLSGRTIDERQRILAVTSGELRGLWQTLRSKYSEEFSAANLPTWHRQEAERCETDRHWFGAVFHWGRLVEQNPSDKTLRDHRDHAAAELAKSEVEPAQKVAVSNRIPPRDPGAGAGLIDLSAHFNAGLSETWFPTNIITSGNDLSALPRGVQPFGSVEFDVRGLIQLSGSALEEAGAQFPRQMKGMAIHQKCRRLHFLHGAAWDALFGTVIGRYQINYVGGESREIKLVFGQNIRDWWFFPAQRQTTSGAALAWQGSNRASQALGMAVRLYQINWPNPLPEVEIATIDFISTMEKPAPFLIAVTAEF